MKRLDKTHRIMLFSPVTHWVPSFAALHTLKSGVKWHWIKLLTTHYANFKLINMEFFLPTVSKCLLTGVGWEWGSSDCWCFLYITGRSLPYNTKRFEVTPKAWSPQGDEFTEGNVTQLLPHTKLLTLLSWIIYLKFPFNFINVVVTN